MLFTAIGLVAGILGYGLTIRPIQPTDDSISYLSSTCHLRAQGVYSGEPTDVAVDPAFGAFRPSCLLQAGLCESRLYRTPQGVNAGLIGAKASPCSRWFIA